MSNLGAKIQTNNKKIVSLHKKVEDMKYLLTVLCGIVFFSSCKDDNEDNVEPRFDRTVIFYISGDNSLSDDVEDNVNDIIAGTAGIGENNVAVLLVDNNNTKPKTMVVKNGAIESQTIFDNDFYMTSPNMMKTLLTSVMNENTAKSYGFVFWGHCTGWFIDNDSISTRAYGPDNNGGASMSGEKWINFSTLAMVFESLPSKFDFIVGDCCLLQCAEVAFEMRNSTKYIIGSPSETPSTGIPYKEIMPYMYSTATDYCSQMADIMNKHVLYDYSGKKVQIPTSVINTAAMDNLASVTKKIIMGENLPYPINTKSVIYYYKWIGKNGLRQPIMFDMQNVFSNNTSDNVYREWKQAFDAAVVYRKPSERWMTSYFWIDDFEVTEENYGGMSMFFPLDQYEDMPSFDPNNRIKNMQWYKAAGIDLYTK